MTIVFYLGSITILISGEVSILCYLKARFPSQAGV